MVLRAGIERLSDDDRAYDDAEERSREEGDWSILNFRLGYPIVIFSVS